MGNCKIMYNTKTVDYHGDDIVEIGKVVNTDTQEDMIYIRYDKNLFKKESCHTCIYVFEDENGEFPVAMTDDLHRECLYNQPNIYLATVLHEYGHYINGDLDANEGLTNPIIMDERNRCIAEGRVMPQELKADAVAISFVGKNTFMRSMDYLIKKRRERGDSGADLAIREFELRKKAAQKYR